MATYAKIVFQSGVEYIWKTKKDPTRIKFSDLKRDQCYGLFMIWGVPKREVSLKIKFPGIGMIGRHTSWEERERIEKLVKKQFGDDIAYYMYKASEDLRSGCIGGIMYAEGCSYISEPVNNESWDQGERIVKLIIEKRDINGVTKILDLDFDSTVMDGYDTKTGVITVLDVFKERETKREVVEVEYVSKERYFKPIFKEEGKG